MTTNNILSAGLELVVNFRITLAAHIHGVTKRQEFTDKINLYTRVQNSANLTIESTLEHSSDASRKMRSNQVRKLPINVGIRMIDSLEGNEVSAAITREYCELSQGRKLWIYI